MDMELEKALRPKLEMMRMEIVTAEQAKPATLVSSIIVERVRLDLVHADFAALSQSISIAVRVLPSTRGRYAMARIAAILKDVKTLLVNWEQIRRQG